MGSCSIKWGDALAEASERLGVAPERLVYLDQAGESSAPSRAGRPARRSGGVRAVRQGGRPDDLVFVVLIGHGSFDGRTRASTCRAPI
jgi:hypothetical protein